MKDFLSKLLSVVLGIAITFTVQGIMDRKHTKKDVRAALELVRTELNTNIDDIGVMTDYLKKERAAAQYFIDHRKTLAKCPADSISYHSSYLFADATAIKTMLRGNPGFMFVKDAVVVDKGRKAMALKTVN